MCGGIITIVGGITAIAIVVDRRPGVVTKGRTRGPALLIRGGVNRDLARSYRPHAPTIPSAHHACHFRLQGINISLYVSHLAWIGKDPKFEVHDYAPASRV